MDNTIEYFKDTYLSSLLDGNRSLASKICRDYLNHHQSIEDLYELVIKQALYKVGELWEQNKISVADEHLATAISEGVLNELYSEVLPSKYLPRKVVLACVENESHQVGLKMVADIFEMHQWETFFVGSGIPTSELIKYISGVKPNVVAISLSVFFNYNNLIGMVEQITKAFPYQHILVGGQALTRISEVMLKKFNNVMYLTDLESVKKYINNYSDERL